MFAVKHEYDVIFILRRIMPREQIQKPVTTLNVDGAGFSFIAALATKAKASKKGKKTKISIQVAVCKCLERVSFADLTIAGICDRANVSHGTFYIYFSNRNGLVADVLMRFSAFVQAKMRQASKGEAGRPARSATSASPTVTCRWRCSSSTSASRWAS